MFYNEEYKISIQLFTRIKEKENGTAKNIVARTEEKVQNKKSYHHRCHTNIQYCSSHTVEII